MEIERTTLPGIGVRQTFTTAQGHRIGIVEYHDGDRRDVVHDDPDDPDRMVGLTLTRDEAVALATLLGFPELVDVAARPAETRRRVSARDRP
ncbi:potassium transporter TrkA [Plantactinospora sp. BC1]|uniref:potassium transporter TrkA n=1 Tax=Plantactinospora sp. BC1 TaxID=2108470 RepID=UPI000D17D2D6|nr:potassium transporter TrkA [Plantactinospora sp. BC1]AVT28369.1 potassium transporter TrkA [Plantactinospora sp. BC1]